MLICASFAIRSLMSDLSPSDLNIRAPPTAATTRPPPATIHGVYVKDWAPSGGGGGSASLEALVAGAAVMVLVGAALVVGAVAVAGFIFARMFSMRAVIVEASSAFGSRLRYVSSDRMAPSLLPARW
jgi:hypothetical protein